jgi:hypothetical protein
MYSFASELLANTHIPFSVLLPLIDETAMKVHSMNPKAAQTGPAKRQDKNVMQHHIDILPTEEQRKVYEMLSEAIAKRN